MTKKPKTKEKITYIIHGDKPESEQVRNWKLKTADYLYMRLKYKYFANMVLNSKVIRKTINNNNQDLRTRQGKNTGTKKVFPQSKSNWRLDK